MFYKALKDNLLHRGFQYKEGLNIDTIPFNPKGNCEAGGLYFTNKQNILYWSHELNCSLIADVVVPEDAKVYQGDDKTKWKADKLILSNIRPISSFVSELSKDEIEWIVRRDGCALQFIKEQTPYLCELAVRQNYYALQFVKDQTPELCKLAVRRYGRALEFVKEQTPELCEMAVKNHGLTLQFVKEQTPYLCELAVRQNGLALQFVKDQTPKLCQLAVQRNRHEL